jgi:ABC-2 type transport system ATP-binding protein
MAANFLEIDAVTKIYTGDKPVTALGGVSLTINKGEVFGLLGVNGAGKTTLSSILATLHPPTSGTVRFKGKEIYTDLWRYRIALGFCPQQSNLDPYLTVEQNLEFAGRYFLLSKAGAKKRADELIEQYRLEKYRTMMVDQLSGGTRQRVLISRALMHKPEIVILDEPTVGLDPDIRRQLWHNIRELRDNGITVILTTHYLDEAEFLSDRICLLREGKVQLIKTMAELKGEHEGQSLENIFLELTKYEQE